MKIPGSFTSITTLSLIATCLLGAAALLPLYGQSAGRGAKPDPGNRLVALLDGYIQTRFEQDEGRFGLSRLPPPVNGHGNIYYNLQVSNEREKEIVHTVNTAPYEYLVEFLHCAHVPGRSATVHTIGLTEEEPLRLTLIAAHSAAAPARPYQFTKEREEFRKTTEAPIEKAAAAVLPRLKRGDSIDTTVGGWHVAMRPVRASKASCLNCHTGTKGGDTLGVMLYAVRPSEKSAAQQAGEPAHSVQ